MIDWSMLAGFAGVNLLLASAFVVTVYRLYEINLGLALFGGALLAVGVVIGQALTGAALWDFNGVEKTVAAVAAASGAAVGVVISAALFEPSPSRSEPRPSKDEQLERIAEQVKELE